ncbi:hypothetical protein PHYC_02246 [Phycisphaerales bacterium]|nr:hypothetical protein PHYC_02246 [Phycisphaerales bacterium]
MRLTATRLRALGWTLVTIGAASLIATAISMYLPRAAASGRTGIVFGDGTLGVVRTSHDIACNWPPGTAWPMWQFVPAGGRILIGPGPFWRPSTSDASVTVTSNVTVNYTLKALWVPLWWPGVIGVLGGAALLGLARRLRPMERCPSCGYELRGLQGPHCPECGEVFRGIPA